MDKPELDAGAPRTGTMACKWERPSQYWKEQFKQSKIKEDKILIDIRYVPK